jgi:hypothetical protein
MSERRFDGLKGELKLGNKWFMIFKFCKNFEMVFKYFYF